MRLEVCRSSCIPIPTDIVSLLDSESFDFGICLLNSLPSSTPTDELLNENEDEMIKDSKKKLPPEEHGLPLSLTCPKGKRRETSKSFS